LSLWHLPCYGRCFAYLTPLVETWQGSCSSWVCLQSQNWHRLGIHLCALLTHVRVIMSFVVRNCALWGSRSGSLTLVVLRSFGQGLEIIIECIAELWIG
jgi:hypothetical protein